ncbi:MAG: FxsA family protein [Rhodospirillales bacterium]|nr:FxsA family protein [Rhodospirillales bacterium]
MGAIILAAFIAVPIIEITLFIEVGGRIGLAPTVGVVILTALAGTALLRHQGLATLRKAQASLQENRFPMDEVFDGLCLVVAGALLLTPGFFTDAIGLSLFVPPFRTLLRRRITAFLIARGSVEVHTSGFNSETVIDGEFEDITPEHDRKTGGETSSGRELPPGKNLNDL